MRGVHLGWIAWLAVLGACDDGGEPAAPGEGALDAERSHDAGASSEDAGPPLDSAAPEADAGDTIDAAPVEQCSVTLRWLQKDAYREGPGRISAFWPPHTTMTLDMECDGEPVASAVMANHGTLPDAVDPEGTPILVEVKQETVQGDRARLTALVEAFEACECGTTFLSLDALDAELVESLVGELSMYLGANLECPGDGGVEAVVAALQAGEIDRVLELAPECRWTEGRSWEEGFDAALEAALSVSAEALADYHVCNNDAVLQASLWGRFVDTGEVVACDVASPSCDGPLWYYIPE